MRSINAIAEYATKDSAVLHVSNMLSTGEWVVEQDETGVWWLHHNPVGSPDGWSVYESSRESVILLDAVTTAQQLGYDWAFES